MARRRSHYELRNISELDVTPLVDLTFLLLIVFMITAPTLEYAFDVSPPELNAAPVRPDEHRIITLTRDGHCLLGNRQIPGPQLAAELARLCEQNPDLELYLRADGDRRYREVVELMRLAREAGFSDVKLVTNEED